MENKHDVCESDFVLLRSEISGRLSSAQRTVICVVYLGEEGSSAAGMLPSPLGPCCLARPKWRRQWRCPSLCGLPPEGLKKCDT